jgi:uncharacterized protein with PIN domain
MATFSDMPNPADELAEAISLLVEPQLVDILDPAWRELGIELPSLLDQLVEAVESSSSRGGAARSRQSAPASLDVLGLLDSIDRWVASGLRYAGYRGRLDHGRLMLVKQWASHAGRWRTTDQSYLYASVGEARRWVTRAENILTPDPQTIETRARPCPHCGKRTAMVHSEDLGEQVQRPSLYLDKLKMVVFCRCCHTQWPSQLWGLLRQMLDDHLATEGARSAR